ncbi:conserved hypothetical protein [Talaromyces stipitatus ATCC 10500]|uniref:Uncharacterized protein n=1 Tax=Talaromyces stipitatus (strain ATCC 10500 / CBS 375.48 / QM 6759 / NRRL 1006) TaxID=441959 RepID=B8MGE4_TALSN|nr:uncharacterized protein TSTA_013640 [Talaromyces stipitatus ATCC 10500]EED16264.1 conserved hypothetical protein [Talaromyces stipitatus ATCC 10500]
MSQFCGCISSSKPEPRTQVPAHSEAGFMSRPELQMQMHHHQPPHYDLVDNGYAPVVPLPRYTPRPMSIHEKTLENNSNFQRTHDQQQHRPDEKNRQDFEPEETLQSQSTGGSSSATVTPAIVDDASSAYSFPSSFGHTSTETRDTPPPPYSSCASSFYSRSRASSLRSHRRSGSLSNYSLNENQVQQGASEAAPSAAYTVPSAPPAAIIASPPMAHVHMSHRQHHHHHVHHPHPHDQYPRSINTNSAFTILSPINSTLPHLDSPPIIMGESVIYALLAL